MGSNTNKMKIKPQALITKVSGGPTDICTAYDLLLVISFPA